MSILQLPQAPALDPAVVAAIRAGVYQEVIEVIGAITDESLEADYRRWWGESYGVPPNRQALATAVAWGRQLIATITAGCQEGAALAATWGEALERPDADQEGQHHG